MIYIKSEREIELMRKAGKLAAVCLQEMAKLVKPGVTPLEIDKACYDWTVAQGATPAPLNYKGYKNSLCISVNEVVCHGVPTNSPLENGDIVNLDVTPILEGYHGDTSATYIVGKVSEDVRLLVTRTKAAMWKGIEQVRPGNTVGDIGHAIESYVKPFGYSVVLDYCGHGIGRIFHEDPQICHVGRPKRGVILKKGMTFTIEPMINMGAYETVLDEKDGWTVRTKDGSLSAQFEHTILVTDTGYEVLTLLPEQE